VAGGI